MTNLLGTLCIALGLGVAAVAAVTVGVYQDNRGLRRELQSARGDRDRVDAQLGAAEGRKRELAAQLEAKSGELEQAERDLADAKDAADRETAAPPPATLAPPRPAKIRVFSGNQNIGTGWLVYSGGAKDARSGQAIYEPILLLDDASRQVLAKTNVVEREVARSTTVNYNYPWLYYYPVLVPVGTNRHVRCDPPASLPVTAPGQNPPPATRPTRESRSFQSTTVQALADRSFLPVVHQAPAQVPSIQAQGFGGRAAAPVGVVAADPTRKSSGLGVPPGI